MAQAIPGASFQSLDGEGPVVISVPHGGRAYPQGIADDLRVPLSAVLALEDRLVDLVGEAARSIEPMLIQTTPRAWIDLNRDERERDPLIDEGARVGARASAKLTKLASAYPCQVHMSRNDRRVNAKSIMGVMMLAAGIGTDVEVECDGDREEEALKALVALINDKFGEGE